MSPRWNWDFEDEQRTRPPQPPAPPAPPAAAPPPATAQARRRLILLRRGTALVAVALLGALILALSGSNHRGSRSPLGGHAGTAPQSALGGSGQATSVDEYQAVLKTLAYTPFIRAGRGGVREVALTFDDGPGPYTPAVLSVLEQSGVRATFFAIGKMERYFGESTVRELHDGDVVGDHTETHPLLARLSAHDQREELFEQIARVELLGGPRPHLFRPPYGSFNATTMLQLRALKLLMVLWSVDTGDYQQPGVPAIVQRVLAGVRPGAILLMHDGGGDRSQTIAALPLIIHALRSRGYTLVTVPQLLVDDPPPYGETLPPNLSGD